MGKKKGGGGGGYGKKKVIYSLLKKAGGEWANYQNQNLWSKHRISTGNSSLINLNLVNHYEKKFPMSFN